MVKVLTAAGLSLTAAISGAFLVAPYEGKVNGTYLDPIGIVTACYGRVEPNLKLGQKFSDLECLDMLHKDLKVFAQDVDRLVVFEVPWHTKAALTSFAYNVGSGALAKSTALKKINNGDLEGGCEELTRWVYAGGKKLRGLELRRADEYKMCVGEFTVTL